jgi:nucleotide-binding universal stress UspA family protein
MMFNRIAVALNGSEQSRQALSYAVELARRDNASIVIAHVEDRICGERGSSSQAAEDQVEADIQHQADVLSSQGIDAEVEMSDVLFGGPAHGIEEIADNTAADLIVVGTLLGTVTQKLLHITRRPVLVVPAGEASRGDRPNRSTTMAR